MKKILMFFIVLVPTISKAQQPPRLQHVKAPRVVTNQTNSTQSVHDNPAENISVGDTCYIICNSVFLRVRPSIEEKTAFPPIALLRNAKVVVRGIPNARWLFIDYFNLDVGVDGYVPRQSVSLKKAD